MSLNRCAVLAMLASAGYVAITFFLENQIPQLWAAAAFSVINMGMLVYAFLRGKTLTISMILLNLVQLAVFWRLHIQVHDILGAAHYSYPSLPLLGDWGKFAGAYLLKGIDLLDIMETYHVRFQEISHQTQLAGAVLFSISFMAGMFMLAVIFKVIHLSKIRHLSAMKWVCVGGLTAALGTVVLTAWLKQWPLSHWYLWPLDNILRMLDIGDAVQIFSWQIHNPDPGMNASAATLFFRVMIAVPAIILAYQPYSYILERGSSRSVGELVAICASSEHPIRDRIEAISELEAFGPLASDAIPDLVNLLVSSGKTIRNTAVQALREIDEEWAASDSARDAIPKLVKLLTSDDIGTQIEAAEILGEFGPTAEEAIPDLIRVLTDSDVLRAAAQTLGKIGTAAIPDLVRVLVDEDEHVRRASVRALNKIDPQWQQTEAAGKEITQFVKDLEKVDDSARTSAVRALGEIGPAAAPHLAKLLADSDVRSLAIKALGEIGSAAEEAALPHLINVLANQSKDVRSLAIQALGKIDPQWRKSENAANAIPYFMNALREGKPGSGEYEVPAEALVEIGTPSIQPLVEALVAGNKDVFNTAAQSLKRIDPRWPQSQGAVKAIPQLTKALGNSQWFVRQVAGEVLGKIGPAAREAVPHLVKALADSNKKARSAIKTALDKILLQNSPHAIQEEEAVTPEDQQEIIRLMKDLTQGLGDARTNAAQALGEMGPAAEKAIPHLVKALANNDANLRTEAGQALGRIDANWHQNEFTQDIIPLFVKSLAGAEVGFPCGMPGEALLEIGTPATRHLIEALADANRDVVNSAIQFLKKTDPQWHESKGARDAVPRLAEALGDGQWFVRRAAADVLGKIGPAAIKAVPYLVKALADQNKEVRSAGKAALDKVTVKS